LFTALPLVFYIFALVLNVSREIDQGGIATDVIILADWLGDLLGAVHFGEVDRFIFSKKFAPGRCEIFAMATPGSEEFNEPRFVPK